MPSKIAQDLLCSSSRRVIPSSMSAFPQLSVILSLLMSYVRTSWTMEFYKKSIITTAGSLPMQSFWEFSQNECVYWIPIARMENMEPVLELLTDVQVRQIRKGALGNFGATDPESARKACVGRRWSERPAVFIKKNPKKHNDCIARVYQSVDTCEVKRYCKKKRTRGFCRSKDHSTHEHTQFGAKRPCNYEMNDAEWVWRVTWQGNVFFLPLEGPRPSWEGLSRQQMRKTIISLTQGCVIATWRQRCERRIFAARHVSTGDSNTWQTSIGYNW